MFPQELSNKPPFTNAFISWEGNYIDEKTIPVKRTGMYWVKNDFIKQSQKSIIQPNSIVQMKNQVLADVYPQNL